MVINFQNMPFLISITIRLSEDGIIIIFKKVSYFFSLLKWTPNYDGVGEIHLASPTN